MSLTGKPQINQADCLLRNLCASGVYLEIKSVFNERFSKDAEEPRVSGRQVGGEWGSIGSIRVCRQEKVHQMLDCSRHLWFRPCVRILPV